MSQQMTFEDLLSATSSPGSASGPTPCAAPDGPIQGPLGPDPALANLSARQAKEQGLLMSGTYGRPCSTLSRSADLERCLVSKLRQRTASLGSTLFHLTWKDRATPSRRWISRLAASGRRISEAGCTSWPTPQEYDSTNANTPEVWKARQERNPKMSRSSSPTDLSVTAQLASWPTPQEDNANNSMGHKGTVFSDLPTIAQTVASWATPSSRDYKDTSDPSTWNCKEERERMDQLGRQVHLSGWGTPQAQDAKHGAVSPSEMNRDPRNLRIQVHATASGGTPSGSPAGTEKRGQLNPAFSRWLQGLPEEWCVAAITAHRSIQIRRRKRGSADSEGTGIPL